MRLVMQRVTSSCVKVDGNLIGSVGNGMNVLVGITHGDSEEDVEICLKKIMKTRLWPSNEAYEERMKAKAKEEASEGGDSSTTVDSKDAKPAVDWAASVTETGYGLLLVSQFTLYAKLKKPKPDYHGAMGGDEAEALFNKLVDRCREEYAAELGIRSKELMRNKMGRLLPSKIPKGGVPKDKTQLDIIPPQYLEEAKGMIQTGQFGADMKVSIENNGPLTILVDSEEDRKGSKGGNPKDKKVEKKEAPVVKEGEKKDGGAAEKKEGGEKKEGEKADDATKKAWEEEKPAAA
jgi:D-aminoacyl-tRNA deacylase